VDEGRRVGAGRGGRKRNCIKCDEPVFTNVTKVVRLGGHETADLEWRSFTVLGSYHLSDTMEGPAWRGEVVGGDLDSDVNSFDI